MKTTTKMTFPPRLVLNPEEISLYWPSPCGCQASVSPGVMCHVGRGRCHSSTIGRHSALYSVGEERNQKYSEIWISHFYFLIKKNGAPGIFCLYSLVRIWRSTRIFNNCEIDITFIILCRYSGIYKVLYSAIHE